MNQGLQQDRKNPHYELLQLSPKKRLDFIINHPSPLKLVRSLPSPDLLLTIREVGAEDALELVELLSPQQVQEIFDLELWTSDELHVEAAGHYFSMLFEANSDTAISQIHGLDIELLGLMLKMVATIYDVSMGEDPGETSELYSVSPDGRFLVCFEEKPQFRGLAQSLKLFLETLYGRDLVFALRLLESVRFELASGLEEESLRWRNNRLLDLGILPREERLQFFAPISLSEIFKKSQPLGFQKADVANDSALLPRVKKELTDKYAFLKAGLLACSDNHKERFWQGLSHAAINIHASLSGDFGDSDKIKKAFDYVMFLAELGLFQACRGQLDQTGEIICQSSPTYLVRFGRSSLIALRKRLVVKTLDPHYVFGDNFCHVDSPLRETARALNLSEPRYYEGLLEPQKFLVRFFSTKTELNATKHAVDELIFRAQLVGSLGFSKDLLDQHCELSHCGIFARSVINAFLTENPTLDAIVPSDIAKIVSDEHKLNHEFSQFTKQFAEMLAQKLSTSETERPLLVEKALNFATTVLIQLEQNWQLVVL